MIEFKETKDFPGYFVSREGEVASMLSGYFKLKESAVGNHGYRVVSLQRDGRSFTKTVHRFVAEAFIPNPENKRCVNHKNGVRTDSRESNLEWVTHKENTAHAKDTLKQTFHGKNPWTGRAIIQREKENIFELYKLGITQKEIAHKLGLHPGSVGRLLRRVSK